MVKAKQVPLTGKTPKGFTRLTTDQKGTTFLVKIPRGIKRSKPTGIISVHDRVINPHQTDFFGTTIRTRPSDSIIEGGTTTERRAVNIGESALSPSERRKAEQSKKDRFCKIVIKKGKRVRVCKVRTPKKKTKTKARSKPRQNNLFGKELFG